MPIMATGRRVTQHRSNARRKPCVVQHPAGESARDVLEQTSPSEDHQIGTNDRLHPAESFVASACGNRGNSVTIGRLLRLGRMHKKFGTRKLVHENLKKCVIAEIILAIHAEQQDAL